MVTLTDTDLAKALVPNSAKWNLKDMSKKEAWLLTTETALRKESKEVWLAVCHGRPTETSILHHSPHLTRKQAKEAAIELANLYEVANEKGYEILVNRIAWDSNGPLAAKIRRDCPQDGHGVWLIVSAKTDTTSPERQAELKMEYELLKLSGPGMPPTPELLDENLTKLETGWLLLDGNDQSAPRTLVQRAITLLPKGGGIAAQIEGFSAAVRSHVAFSTEAIVFSKF